MKSKVVLVVDEGGVGAAETGGVRQVVAAKRDVQEIVVLHCIWVENRQVHAGAFGSGCEESQNEHH